jgi:hypothetical protein
MVQALRCPAWVPLLRQPHMDRSSSRCCSFIDGLSIRLVEYPQTSVVEGKFIPFKGRLQVPYKEHS